MNLNDVYSDNKIEEISKPDISANDVFLLRQVACGDEGAFTELYQRYHKPIYNYVLHLIYEPKEAEEILQEIFLAVWRGAYRFREQAQVKTWMYRIAHYQAVSWLRKHRKEVAYDDIQEIDSKGPEQISVDTWDRIEVQKALNCLSIKHRAVLELAFIHDMAYKEIAEVVGCPVGTVKSRMSYALKALNSKLKRTDYVE
jgi:RNA polymerase sigma-70 factor (ECF subfamily)